MDSSPGKDDLTDSSYWDSGRAAYTDSRGRLWLGTEGGIILYNPSGEHTHFPFDGNGHQLINGIYEDSSGTVHVVANHFIGAIDFESKSIMPSKILPFVKKLEEVQAAAKSPLFEDDRGGALSIYPGGGGCL